MGTKVTRALLEKVARQKALGATWEEIEAKLSIPVARMIRWPQRFEGPWREAYQLALKDLFNDAMSEAVFSLRGTLRDGDKRLKVQASNALVRLWQTQHPVPRRTVKPTEPVLGEVQQTIVERANAMVQLDEATIVQIVEKNNDAPVVPSVVVQEPVATSVPTTAEPQSQQETPAPMFAKSGKQPSLTHLRTLPRRVGFLVGGIALCASMAHAHPNDGAAIPKSKADCASLAGKMRLGLKHNPTPVERSATPTYRTRTTVQVPSSPSTNVVAPVIRSSTLPLLLMACVPVSAEEVFFERDVLPLLTKQCLGCHGGLRQKGGLDMRTIPALLKGGDTGSAVHKGHADKSELWKRIANDEMPPHDKKLTMAEKALLKQWIADGLPTLTQRMGKVDPLLPKGKHEPAVVAKTIDQHIAGPLQQAGLTALPRCDDATFLRRAYLDFTGRIPTADEATRFLKDGDRVKLIDTLLATSAYGEQMGRTWRDWICPPELPSDPNGGKQPHTEAHNLGRWFGTRFAAGDSWDRIVRDVLTVEGELKSKPQVIFFGLVGEGGKTTANGSARATASLFLGVQLQCAECHDDPYRAWAQQEYWALAAFFKKTTGDFNKISESTGSGSKIVIPKSAFKNAGNNVAARFLGTSNALAEKDDTSRKALVDWLTSTQNPYFAKAFVNRLWFYLFARGLVNPVDDLRELNPPSHPGLLELLANEFTASGYDVKHLLRCIAQTETYQLTSRVPAETSDAVLAGTTTLFGRMPLRVLTADMLLDSLKLAYGDPKLDLRAPDTKEGNTNGESAPVADAYLEFLRRFGTNKEDATDFTHGIPQMLTLINHPRLLNGGKPMEAFVKAYATPEQQIDRLYLATLSRLPTPQEMQEAQAYLKKADPMKGATGLLWMLVNRSEFMFIR